MFLFLRLSDEILILILIMCFLLFRPRIPSRFVSVGYIYKLLNAFVLIHPQGLDSKIELYGTDSSLSFLWLCMFSF